MSNSLELPGRKVRPTHPRGLLFTGHACENHCLFCEGRAALATAISLAEAEHGLRRLREFGAETLALSGGDPTQNPRLLEIVALARSLGFREIRLFTHARPMAKKDFAARLAEAGVSSAMVSLLGDSAQVHDKVAGISGAFEETTGGMRALVDAGIELLVNTAVCRVNFLSLTDIVEFVDQRFPECRMIQFGDLFPTSAVLRRPGLHVDYAVVQSHLHAALARAIALGRPCSTQYFPLCVVFPWLAEALEFDEEGVEYLIADPRAADGLTFNHRGRSPWHRFPQGCQRCSLRPQCQGVPVTYLQRFGVSEIISPLEHLDSTAWAQQRERVKARERLATAYPTGAI